MPEMHQTMNEFCREKCLETVQRSLSLTGAASQLGCRRPGRFEDTKCRVASRALSEVAAFLSPQSPVAAAAAEWIFPVPCGRAGPDSRPVNQSPVE